MKQPYRVLLPLVFIFFNVASGYAYETIHIQSDVPQKFQSANLIAYLFKPNGEGPFPTIVWLHGCDGISKSEIKKEHFLPKILNDQGFAALFPDSLSSRGINDERLCYSWEESGAARYFRIFDAFNVLAFLRQQSYVDKNNIFLVGSSHGGSVAIQVAQGGTRYNYPDHLRYTAVVAYYPGCDLFIDYLVSPLLVLSGAKDTWAPPDECISQEDSVKGEDYEVVVYPEAHHGFDVPESLSVYGVHLVGGHPPSAKDSRERMLELFNERMTP